MVAITLRYPYCQSERLVKYGITPNGKQRYRCQTCGQQHQEEPGSHAYSEVERALILQAYEECSSLRMLTTRTFGVAQHSDSLIKKALTLPPLEATLLSPVFFQMPDHARNYFRFFFTAITWNASKELLF